MLEMNKTEVAEKFRIDAKAYASVCNSCACGGGTSSCNTTCKGCKDKSENIKLVKNVYAR